MSWNIHLNGQTSETLEAAARAEYVVFRENYHDEEAALVAMDEQFEVALNAAGAILDATVVGDVPVSVSLAGHANPGHAVRQGYAPDYVLVRLVQE